MLATPFRWFAPTALALSLAAGHAAAADTYKLSVKAGNCDRGNAPVCVRLEVPAELAKARTATLVDATGKRLVGQLTPPGLAGAAPALHSNAVARELWFILPELKKGASLELTATVDAAEPAKGFAWKDAPGEQADLSLDGRPVLRYMYKALDPQKREETYKVYHHVFDPTGEVLLTKGPGGLYTHHRGLFFGYCNITYAGGKIDTWGCGGSSNQLHEKFLAQEAGPVLGRHLVQIAWRGGEKTVVREQRELTAFNAAGGTLIEFNSRLSTAGGKVKLDGNAPHAGFQFRAAREVGEASQKETYYLRPDGKGEPGQARASAMDLPWDAIGFVLGGKRYTVLYLDKPTNPKPAEYNERTYGRFGSFFRYELDEGKDLLASYRVWAQAGEMTQEQAAALSRHFVEPVEVTVR